VPGGTDRRTNPHFSVILEKVGQFQEKMDELLDLGFSAI
jgi:hypothetical protein